MNIYLQSHNIYKNQIWGVECLLTDKLSSVFFSSFFLGTVIMLSLSLRGASLSSIFFPQDGLPSSCINFPSHPPPLLRVTSTKSAATPRMAITASTPPIMFFATDVITWQMFVWGVNSCCQRLSLHLDLLRTIILNCDQVWIYIEAPANICPLGLALYCALANIRVWRRGYLWSASSPHVHLGVFNPLPSVRTQRGACKLTGRESHIPLFAESRNRLQANCYTNPSAPLLHTHHL